MLTYNLSYMITFSSAFDRMVQHLYCKTIRITDSVFSFPLCYDITTPDIKSNNPSTGVSRPMYTIVVSLMLSVFRYLSKFPSKFV